MVTLNTFGDVRRLILDTIWQLREGSMSPNVGMAIAANMKTLNDNINAEISAAKLSIMTEDRANNFGKLVSMGTRAINDK
jgi:hypothetical protein